MGLFDSLIKAVEDGTVEKRLSSAVDKLEMNLDRVTKKAKQASNAVETQGKRADIAVQKLEN